MSVNCRINFTSFSFSLKKPNTIKIVGNSAQFGSSSKFELEYSGAGLVQNFGYIPEIVIPHLKIDLNKIIDFGPYERKELNKIFKELKHIVYEIDGDKVTQDLSR